MFTFFLTVSSLSNSHGWNFSKPLKKIQTMKKCIKVEKIEDIDLNYSFYG